MTEQLSKHFRADEFACPCCGQSKMQPDTIARLERLREAYGQPIRVVEGGGYRCAAYEHSEHSAHREGRAIDPAILREDLFRFIQLAQAEGFTGIGAKNKDGRWQCHIDDAANLPGIRPRPWFWTY